MVSEASFPGDCGLERTLGDIVTGARVLGYLHLYLYRQLWSAAL